MPLIILYLIVIVTPTLDCKLKEGSNWLLCPPEHSIFIQLNLMCVAATLGKTLYQNEI